MTETITLDPHYDCTASHNITELEGPAHLASLMPGTIILVNGWEYMRLSGHKGWVGTSGVTLSDDDFWATLRARKRGGWSISLLHVGAA